MQPGRGGESRLIPSHMHEEDPFRPTGFVGPPTRRPNRFRERAALPAVLIFALKIPERLGMAGNCPGPRSVNQKKIRREEIPHREGKSAFPFFFLVFSPEKT